MSSYLPGFLDATALAEKIRSEEISPEDAVKFSLEKIKKLNPLYNAVTQVFSSDFIEQQISSLPKKTPFAGVPILLKDLGSVLAGTKTTQGSVFFKDFMPDPQYESEMIKRFRRAGFIFIGKTNTPELGLSSVTEPVLYGPCRNPWNSELTSGGSSGGSASAVVSGMVTIAQASDGGGSIRIPAACCGLVGLKPTRARVPYGPVVGEAWAGLGTQLVLAHSIRDVAAVLDELAGPEVGDPYYAPPLLSSYVNEIAKPLPPLQIAFNLDSPLGLPVASICQDAVKACLKILEAHGHSIVSAAPRYDAHLMRDSLYPIVSGNTALFITLRENQLQRKVKEDELEWATHLMVAAGRSLRAEDYAAAIATMHFQARKIAEFFVNHDILVTPVLAKLPVPIGYFSRQNFSCIDDYHQAMQEFSPFTALWNQTGQPALVVPIMHTADGLPVAVQLIARFGEEETLLKLGAILEKQFIAYVKK